MRHASLRIEIAGQVLLIDPWLTGNPLLPEAFHANAVEGASHILLSHGHFDHIVDTLPLAKQKGIPILGQYDLMHHWADAEAVETIGFNKGGTVHLGDVAVTMVHAVHSSSMSTQEGPKWVSTECGFVFQVKAIRSMSRATQMSWRIWGFSTIFTGLTLAF